VTTAADDVYQNDESKATGNYELIVTFSTPDNTEVLDLIHHTSGGAG